MVAQTAGDESALRVKVVAVKLVSFSDREACRVGHYDLCHRRVGYLIVDGRDAMGLACDYPVVYVDFFLVGPHHRVHLHLRAEIPAVDHRQLQLARRGVG